MIATATLLGLAAAASVVGSGISAIGMVNQGNAQKQMGEYNAKIQSNNAAMAIQQSQFAASQIRQRNMRLKGAQAAAASKSGLDLSGSVNDVMYDSAVQGELNAASQIYKGQVSADQYQSSGNMSEAAGKSASQQSYWGAAGSVLGGVGQGVGYLGRIRPGADDGYPVLS
jgi:hypothetical protein